eukprot:1671910-Rhodomonas_salina.1
MNQRFIGLPEIAYQFSSGKITSTVYMCLGTRIGPIWIGIPTMKLEVRPCPGVENPTAGILQPGCKSESDVNCFSLQAAPKPGLLEMTVRDVLFYGYKHNYCVGGATGASGYLGTRVPEYRASILATRVCKGVPDGDSRSP